jgi:hypothetical protein
MKQTTWQEQVAAMATDAEAELIGRRLAALRPTETKPCRQCGQEATKRVPWVYCSPKCKQRAYRERKKT